MDASEIYSRRLNAKEVIFQKKEWTIHYSGRIWTNQTFWRRSGTENTHLDTGAPRPRRKSKGFSWRIRRVSSATSRLTSGCRWSNSWLLVHVRKLHIPPSRWTQSQTVLAERRIIPYSTEIHWRLQNYENEFGCHAWTPHRWLLEYRWIKRCVRFLDRFHTIYSIRRETSRRIYVVRGRLTKRQVTSRPDYIWPELWIKFGRNAKLKEKKNGPLKNRNSIMPEDCGEFISLTLRTRNSKKPLRMLEENWKPMAPAMPCKTSKNSKHGETCGKTNDFKSKFSCILKASESTRLRMEEFVPSHHEDHIAGKGGQFTATFTIWYTNLFLCLKPWRFLQQRQQWTRNRRNLKRFRRGTWRKSEVNQRWSM